jgi:dolichyl-phosphate-mannose--protein O-mannosyl transferase
VCAAEKPVTYGSAIKLRHRESEYYLNSEEKNLNSGSGQQLVTTIKDAGSTNTLWWIRPPFDSEHNPDAAAEYYYNEDTETEYRLAMPIPCGSVVRLTHVGTGRNLHSHGAQSPLSRQQEVTAFGEGDWKGDAGDNFRVVCLQPNNDSAASPPSKYWIRGETVRFQHVDTEKWLGSSKNTEFNQQTCGRNCPIMGHLEVFGRASSDKFADFYAEQGVHLSM